MTERRGIGMVQRWSVLLAAVLVWEVVARAAESAFFPPPSAVGRTLGQRWFSGPITSLFLSDLAWDNLLPSLLRLLAGWSMAAALGVAAGLALGRSPRALQYVGPLFAFFRALPPPILLPVFLLVLGLGAPAQLATIVFGSVWPVLLNASDGARSVDPTQTATAQAFRIPRHQWVWGVVLPAALPKIFAGLRVSLSIALILMIVSELVGATEGLGYQLSIAQDQFDYLGMWSIVVLLGALGYLLNATLLGVQQRMLRGQLGPEHGRA